MAEKLKLQVKIDQLGMNNQILGPKGEPVEGVFSVSAPIVQEGELPYVLVKIGIESGHLQLGQEYLSVSDSTFTGKP